jgi:hypothetical protein
VCTRNLLLDMEFILEILFKEKFTCLDLSEHHMQGYRKRPPPRSTLGTPLGAGSFRKLALERAFKIWNCASGFRKLASGCKNAFPANHEALHPGASFRNPEGRFRISEARFLNALATLRVGPTRFHAKERKILILFFIFELS